MEVSDALSDFVAFVKSIPVKSRLEVIVGVVNAGVLTNANVDALAVGIFIWPDVVALSVLLKVTVPDELGSIVKFPVFVEYKFVKSILPVACSELIDKFCKLVQFRKALDILIVDVVFNVEGIVTDVNFVHPSHALSNETASFVSTVDGNVTVSSSVQSANILAKFDTDIYYITVKYAKKLIYNYMPV